MDKALALCQGSFIAAAKLLDMGPSSFRGRVYRNPSLREKWGCKKRGPGVKIGFTIERVRDDRQFGSLGCIRDLIEALSADEQRQLLLWLQEHPEPTPPVGCTPVTPQARP
jgi:hypothetical protein